MEKLTMADDDSTTAIDLARLARDYYDAALAVNREIGERPSYALNAPIPAILLLAQCIEFTIKSFLRYNGYSLNDLQRFGMDLERCWSEAKNNNIDKYIKIQQSEIYALGQINNLQLSFELRYTRVALKTLPAFDTLDGLASKLLDAVGPAVGFGEP